MRGYEFSPVTFAFVLLANCLVISAYFTLVHHCSALTDRGRQLEMSARLMRPANMR